MTPEQHDGPLGGLAVGAGLSWSWHLDVETLLTALSEPAPWNRLPPPAPGPAAPAASPDPEPSAAEPAEAGTATGPVDPVEADFADYLDAVDAGRSSVFPLSMAAGRVAEILPAGPDLAAWLACNPARDLEDGALAGVAAACRRLAAWAQAGERVCQISGVRAFPVSFVVRS
jgi:hypothetical protein